MNTKKKSVKKTAPRAKTKPKRQASKLVNFKASAKDREVLKANAKRYAKGNVGAWLRLVGADPRLLKTNRIRVRKAA